MARFDPAAVLGGDDPGPWSDPVSMRWDERDAQIYALGIGCTELRQVYERDPRFALFPTFAIRWGWAGLRLDPAALPLPPGPLAIDAERSLEQLAPLPRSGSARVRSRLLAVHPRPRGSAFVECETEVADDPGRPCMRLVSGLFQRGVERLGDIEPFEGRGRSVGSRLPVPEREPDFTLDSAIAANQALIYRLSGDDNPLHVDPEAARFGGFEAPILHGLCTYGVCARLLLAALADHDPARFGRLKLRFAAPVLPGDSLTLRGWRDGDRRVQFDARVGGRTVVSDAFFEWR